MHCHHQDKTYTRRDFLTRTSLSLGALSMASFLDPMGLWAKSDPGKGILGQPHFAPKVKRVIYLFQSGAPSQLDLFDYKPLLNKMNGQDLPESVRQGQRLTGMTAGQASTT